MAELADRLRLFASGPRAAPAAGVRRLAVAGRLVARQGEETDHAAAARLGEAAVALARAVDRAPAAVDARLLALVADLGELLEDYLAAVDAGRSPATFLAGQDWCRIAGAALPERPADPRAGPALLLVASDFRRGAVHDKLGAAGIPCEVLDDPRAVPARLERDPPPRWIVCDDQEPRRLLERVRRLLDGRPRGARPPLVLLAPGSAPAEKLAARRGADLVWQEPFEPAELTD
jgi:CheY-like chemotaxis protein